MNGVIVGVVKLPLKYRDAVDLRLVGIYKSIISYNYLYRLILAFVKAVALRVLSYSY